MTNMASYSIVSVRLPAELRRKMRELGIEPSKVMRRAIEEEVKRKEAERLKERISELADLIQRISTEDVVADIRRDRDGR